MRAKRSASTASIETVTRDRPASASGCAMSASKMSVSGDRDVERVAFDGLHLAELAHHVDQAFAQERLAAGQADFGDAQSDEDARHAQVVGDRHLRKLRAIAARAAIDAPVVAAIGDGDPQIADAPSVFVGE